MHRSSACIDNGANHAPSHSHSPAVAGQRNGQFIAFPPDETLLQCWRLQSPAAHPHMPTHTLTKAGQKPGVCTAHRWPLPVRLAPSYLSEDAIACCPRVPLIRSICIRLLLSTSYKHVVSIHPSLYSKHHRPASQPYRLGISHPIPISSFRFHHPSPFPRSPTVA